MRGPLLCATALFTLILSPSGALAADAEVVTLDPSGPWQLDMAEHKCRIARLFGPQNDPTVFYLEQWDPSRRASWTVAGGGTKGFRSGRMTSFAFGPNGDHGEFRPRRITFGKFGASYEDQTTVAPAKSDEAGQEVPDAEWDWKLNPRGLPMLDAEGAKSLDRLSISQGRHATLTLRTGELSAPVSAMNACMEDLAEHWGFEPDQQRRVVSPPQVLNFSSVARRVQEEYPSEALSKGAQADFHLRLSVNADGSVQSCALISQTIASDFELAQRPCKIFSKWAKIDPARDVDGNAVRTYYTVRILYAVN